jgi:hypothetical protein
MVSSAFIRLLKSGLPAMCGLLSASAVGLQDHALALDFALAFNQNPVYSFFTINPDGTVSQQWVPQAGGPARDVGDYEVEGLILGLSDNLSRQVPAQITLSKASHDPLSIGNYRFREGSGFDVVNGEIQRTFWIGELDSTTTIRRLVFTPGGFNPSFAELESGPADPFLVYTQDGQKFWDFTRFCPVINPNDICSVTVITTPSFTGSTPVFSPLQTPSGGPSSGPIHHTPNPLSVLAVAAGYQASRRLRRRIRQAANSRLL